MLAGLQWRMLAVLGALATAATGWLLITALCSLGWLGSAGVDYGAVLLLATQGWLLAHGVPIHLTGTVISLVPLGYSALIVLTTSGFGAMVGRRAVRDLQPLAAQERGWLMLRTAGAFAGSYTVLVLIGALLSEGDAAFGRVLLGCFILAFLPALAGSAGALGWRPAWTPRHQWWLRLPASLAAGILVLIVAGSVVSAWALLRYHTRVIALHQSLDAGALGGFVLSVMQLAWIPNVVVWAGSWTLGAGFSMGAGTVVSPIANQLGALPAVPLFGAVPPSGPGPGSALWWLVAGVGAGVASAWVLVSARQQSARTPDQRPVRIDQLAVIGGLAGILSGLAFAALAACAGGDIGITRLVGLGPRMSELLVLAPTLLGISGLVTGTLMGLPAGRGR